MDYKDRCKKFKPLLQRSKNTNFNLSDLLGLIADPQV